MSNYNSLDDVPLELKQKVSKYVSDVDGSTFVIRGLPSELTGGVMARYSRAKTGLVLTLINEFLDENGQPSQEKGSAIMDRVLNAFGDDSVGELEGVHVGIEDVSQLMTKQIEDRRIGGSPIEQSTRYVMYNQKGTDGKWRYLRPVEIMKSGFSELYEEVNDRSFEVYSESIEKLKDFFSKEFPRENFSIAAERQGEKVMLYEKDLQTEDEKKSFRIGYNFTVRCAALDVGRCLLPSSTFTHLGIFGNGRFYTNLITHLKSNELEEGKQRGSDLERELNTVIPTYIKRNSENPKVAMINQQMNELASELFRGIQPQDDKVTLVGRADYLDEVVASSLFPYTNISLQQILEEVQKMPAEKKQEVLTIYSGRRESRRDRTGRGLEAGYPITFDLVGGFAEYRDLERHRMLTQQQQNFSVDLGFIMPPEMSIIGLEKKAEEVVTSMEGLNSKLKHAGLGEATQYATLFNHRIRWMMGMNLREFQHFAELRTQPAGHFSYRSMVMEMAQALEKRDPWTEELLEHIDFSDPGNKISRAQEQSKIAGKNLAKSIDGSTDF